MVEFIQENLNYPTEALLRNIEGQVVIRFIVEKDGRLGNLQVLRSLGFGCDEEALRIIRMMPDWIPGRQRGREVRVQFNLVIKFQR